MRVVAIARLVMAGFLLLSSLVVPEAQGSSGFVAALLIAYFVFAAGVAVLSVRTGTHRLATWLMPMQAVDFAAIITLLYATKGANSPFFSPLVYLIVSATLLQGSRGALIVGLATSAAFVPACVQVFFDDSVTAVIFQSAIVRIGYLLAIVGLLVAVGRHVERVVAELSRLSHPMADDGAGDEPPMRSCLEHALRVFGAKRGAVLWVDQDEPGLQLIALDAQGQERRVCTGEQQRRIMPVGQDAYLCRRTRDGFEVRSATGVAGLVVPDPRVTALLDFERAIGIRLSTDAYQGWVLVFDPEDPANEDLAIGAIAAAQASVMLDRWRGEQVRRHLVASEARLSLGRDLHDGILQVLAASTLQLDAMLGDPTVSENVCERLKRLRRNLVDEQRELRHLLAATRPERSTALPAADDIEELGERLSRFWGLRINCRVRPDDLALRSDELFDVTRLIREGVSNAARHGGAGQVDVELSRADEGYRLTVSDDGRGFDDAGDEVTLVRPPRTLQERARAMGGELAVATGRSGTSVTISWPGQRP